MHAVPQRQPAIRGKPRLVPLPHAGAHAFMATRYHEPKVHFLWHYHHEVELVWIRKGSGLRYVGRAVEKFESGDLVLLGSHLPHTWASTSTPAAGSDWSVIQFLPENWSREFWRLPEVHEMNDLLSKASCGIQFSGKARWHIGRQIEAMVSRKPQSLENLIQFLSLFRQLLKLPHHFLNEPEMTTDLAGSDVRVEYILNWIQNHFAEPITQAAAAAQLKMSPQAFSRWFKMRVGRVFQRYLNEFRVAKVCARLADQQESVTQAAFNCGYNNLANFNRRFREITGQTPSEFRNQSRQTQEQAARKVLLNLGARSAIRLPAGLGHIC